MKINPDCLRSLRRKKRLSRPQLAERSEISTRTIQRLENEPERCQKTREDTLNRLAKALDVEPGVLTGDLPLPESDKAPVVNSKPVQIGAQIAPKARLAYDLVKRRYGVSATDIINMAPLFFALLAEGSLAWRREKLEEACEATEQLDEIGGFWCGSLGSGQTVMADGITAEEDSIDKADLFGEHLFDDTDAYLFLDDFFDPLTDNPFARYLRKLKDELNVYGIVDVDGGDLDGRSNFRFPGYDICRDELGRIANGSSNARWALETGYARISKIPEELMAEEAGEERAKWLEERLLDFIKDKKDILKLIATTPKGDDLRKIFDKVDSRKTNTETEKGGDDQ